MIQFFLCLIFGHKWERRGIFTTGFDYLNEKVYVIFINECLQCDKLRKEKIIKPDSPIQD